ncbi:hypothetical protein CRI94_00635 [Longibacter salinarum]|uniref:Cation:proton antiporter n=1 Tax=Longibacter salinarum TaxID=1850348 RepID=A0A2A8D203_9BACT|nr:cation:proton antiporter [Longibacter salinarum]PEN14837.1 hypothetical protein CRI94_00635 [Longibacter salinarum]
MITVAYLLIGCALLLVTGRLLYGPSLSDRIVALDMLSFIAVGLIAIYTVATKSAVMLDAAMVLALIAFLGTVAFARFVERIRPQKENATPATSTSLAPTRGARNDADHTRPRESTAR